MPVLWTIRCYVSHRRNDEIRAWYDGQSARVRAKFLSRLKFLAQTPRSGWKREPFDLLRNECEGLGEIRFNADGVQHRPLGFFSPGMVFTIVICAQEKNGRFEPRNACAIGLSRKAEIERDASRCKKCDFPLE
jgi:hypothetical protein